MSDKIEFPLAREVIKGELIERIDRSARLCYMFEVMPEVLTRPDGMAMIDIALRGARGHFESKRNELLGLDEHGRTHMEGFASALNEALANKERRERNGG